MLANKSDYVILGMIILGLILAGWLTGCTPEASQGHRIAVITQNKQLIERIDLDAVTQPREIKISGNYAEIIKVESGRIRFAAADCPDKICVNTGWLDEPGETAVCLPNRVIVTIED